MLKQAQNVEKTQKNQYKLRKINKKCILPLFSAWKIAITCAYTEKSVRKTGSIKIINSIKGKNLGDNDEETDDDFGGVRPVRRRDGSGVKKLRFEKWSARLFLCDW